MCFTGVGLRLSCRHRSITTAALVNTSSTPVSSLATQQRLLWETAQPWLLSAGVSRPKQQM